MARKSWLNQRKEIVMNDQTKYQIASVMLQRGTPEQQKEALLYCTTAPTTTVQGNEVNSEESSNEK